MSKVKTVLPIVKFMITDIILIIDNSYYNLDAVITDEIITRQFDIGRCVYLKHQHKK